MKFIFAVPRKVIDSFKRHPFLPVLILSLCFMPLAHIMTASDAGHYLRVARDFLDGKGYHSSRIHSFFIAIAFWFGGISISSAYWVNRVFWLLNLVVVYLLGRELFNSRRVGALAAVLLLSSYVFNYWAFRMSLGIDIPFALFCNLFLLVAIAAIKHNRMILFIFAGAAMSLAFMVSAELPSFPPTRSFIWQPIDHLPLSE
ncbi:MAG: glycosyltransferase family 39 protein [Deltaproteobacteria bacterium]|nr:glycosyltransferase family 39 protein [Deltaproteobacteria bacterium]